MFPFTIVYLLCLQIYVVDSLDRERIGRARQEFQVTCDELSATEVGWLPLISSADFIPLSGYYQRSIHAQQCHFGVCQ